jgi:hypothetical protein
VRERTDHVRRSRIAVERGADASRVENAKIGSDLASERNVVVATHDDGRRRAARSATRST